MQCIVVLFYVSIHCMSRINSFLKPIIVIPFGPSRATRDRNLRLRKWVIFTIVARAVVDVNLIDEHRTHRTTGARMVMGTDIAHPSYHLHRVLVARYRLPRNHHPINHEGALKNTKDRIGNYSCTAEFVIHQDERHDCCGS